MTMLAYITVPSETESKALARQLVEFQLAAGANVCGPMHSFYRWQGQVCEADEWQIFVQLRKADFEQLREFIAARHSHLVPCVLALEIAAGHQSFLRWIENKGESPCVLPSSPCKL